MDTASRNEPSRGPREERPLLVTGSTGYIGGRLVPRLLDAGHRVRCLCRSPRKLANQPWAASDRLEIVAGDLEDPESTEAALRGCRAAYYLVHSMIAKGSDYAETDRRLATTFARAAERCGVERILYLGGLGETGPGLSEHLASRREVEAALAAGSVPVTVLRAAMIIGSGSASFEILRYLVERLPFRVTPSWVRTRCQPIAVHNVLEYLVRCLEVPKTVGATLDIGGPRLVRGLYEHGEAGHGKDLFQEVVHVPLVFWQPGVVRAGRVDRGVQTLDIYPTILDLAGIEPEPCVTGVSLRPDIDARSPRSGADGDRPLVSHLVRKTEGRVRYLMSSVIRGDHKLIQYESPSGEPGVQMLFDVASDPRESRNLLEERPALPDELRAQLREVNRPRPDIATDSTRMQLDARTLEHLRELGYVDE